MSMFKSVFVWLALAIAALVYASQHYTIGGWEHLRIVSKQVDAPKSDSGLAVVPRFDNRSWAPARWVSAPSISGDMAPPKPKTASIRIATLNLQGFGESKASKLAVMEILSRVLRSFDVVALQDVQPDQGDVLPRLVDRINQSDRTFDYCLGPRVGKGMNSMHFAFVFDSERVDIDRYQLYTVDDPTDQLEYEPLVAWFRTRNVHEEEAFTFSLVNLRISPPHADREISLLPELLRSIVRDGREEDDILLAGDFACGNDRMENLRRIGMRFALEGVTTTFASDEMLDNILFPAKATDEYLGRSGTIDFLRQLNLTPEQALQVSNHMPVWADFSATEGGMPGYAP